MSDAPTHNPATDRRANYDYTDDSVDRPAVVKDLEPRVAGDVRFDSYSRQQYATDASSYEVTPIGVVLPESTDDVETVMEYCADRKIPVLPRGGGTSLAGQAVNEAVVLDFTRYMDGLLDIDPNAKTARVQPGITLSVLNEALAPHGLKFAPDPAAGDRSVIGGAIGNNSTGSHSLKYGLTEAYVEECEVVLADGTVTTFGEVTLDELREGAGGDDLESRIYAEVLHIVDDLSEEVEARYPDLKRNVSGYNLDSLVEEAESGSVNLARLLAGSEGTLALITETKISLVDVPEAKAMALLAYRDIIDAMHDVAPIVDHDAAAVELVDDVLLDLASQTAEFEAVAELVPEGTQAILLVEFYAADDDHGREQVTRLIEDRVEGAGHAFDSVEAHTKKEQADLWKLRKAGQPILMSRTSDEKHISFIEDAAVPPEHLPEYVEGFQQILEAHGTFASFYAHAGPGVLHVRPLVSLKDEADIEMMESIADDVTDLVVEFGGSVSGEHGDGRARTQWNEKLYGETLWQAFRDLKTAFDPDWLLNPGQVCGDVKMTENLRYGPDYEFDAGFSPSLNWENDNGFQGMAELCHGCGGCRGHQETTGGVMCPTYRAANEEGLSTRGRANMLRQAMSGDLSEDELFADEFQHEVLDLCIGCKGCARDCPSEVDMAKMKAEIQHAHHQKEGSSLRDKLFANIDRLSALGSLFAPVSNFGTKIPGARAVLEGTLGIAKDRTLPEFHRETLRKWYRARGSQVSEAQAERKVVLFPDTYTNYSHPEAGKAAIRVLEAAGVHVRLAEQTDSGRPAHSKGFLGKSRNIAAQNVEALAPQVEDGWDVVLVEPSDAVMFQSDYLDLLSGEDVETVAANTYGVCEYLDGFRLDENITFGGGNASLTYHGHCHQKATKKDHHAVGVLRRAGYDVDPLDSGCCGMAGSFGYEAEHFSMSKAIGNLLFDQVDESSGDQVVAPGASCRTQLGDREGATSEPMTPIEMVAVALGEY
ncbi:FAD-binding and (Fe-S)-binding domain-containing protein [Haladaptatus sp. DYSN1]|uniref:FAD-binding and (Fe-S)-binding domain-containing protein n=1 Tax=unclassified Haladaptatus TaxID=2622732 RepID=UPI002406B8CC|nr:FAD-binding and (Fe-S)-binding domain-containing protein [Haladaptatus sp. DYSN1]